MNTFGEMQQALQSDLNVTSGSSLFPPDTIKLALNRSYIKCKGLFLWHELEDAKKTSTEASQEYYEYPEGWRTDSIYKLVVDGIDYGDPLVFKDYMYEKEENLPSGLEKMWTNHGRKFFIYPIPTTNGANNICVFGQMIGDGLTNSSDLTIFSYSKPECNEAVVIEAKAILQKKGEKDNVSAFASQEAKEILVIAYDKDRKMQAKYEKTQPMFDVPDFFPSGRSGRGGQNTGNFGNN